MHDARCYSKQSHKKRIQELQVDKPQIIELFTQMEQQTVHVFSLPIGLRPQGLPSIVMVPNIARCIYTQTNPTQRYQVTILSLILIAKNKT